jgi:hypothetical protein
MSTSPVLTPVPKVRTFAADLNSVRSKKTTAPISTVSKSVPVLEPIIVDTKKEGVVPPFHSFSNSTKDILNAPTKQQVTSLPSTQAETQQILTKSSTLSVESALKESLPAVIITDTKRKRFKLSEALATSISDWWSSKKEVAKKKKIPRYTVPEAERRKGVIQKATAKTGRTSTADHSAVISRIKATKQIPHEASLPVQTIPVQKKNEVLWETATPVTLPEKVSITESLVILPEKPVILPSNQTFHIDAAPAEAWESNIQSKVNALTKPAVQSPLVSSGKEFTKIKDERARVAQLSQPVEQTPDRVITPIIPKLPENLTPSIRPIVPEKPLSLDIPDLPTQAKFTQAQEPNVVTVVVPTPISRPRITPTIPLTTTPNPLPLSEPELLTSALPDLVEPSVPVRLERRFAPPREEKRSLFSNLVQTNNVVFIAFGVLLFVVISGLGMRAYLDKAPTISEPTGVAETTLFPDTTFPTETYFVSSAIDLTKAIEAQKSATESLIEINFLTNAGVTLSPADLLQVLDADVLFDFRSTLTEVAIGTYRETPWVVFTVSDKNTAFGGMLDWENYLYSDLAPILTTKSGLSRNRYEDGIIDTIDVRILKNADGSEAIVYGFTNYNSLLITTNTTAFLNLAGKMR